MTCCSGLSPARHRGDAFLTETAPPLHYRRTRTYHSSDLPLEPTLSQTPARYPSSPGWHRVHGVALGLIIALGMLLTWLGRRNALTTGGDEASYLLLAESLASGHYQDVHLPGSPPHAQYPPGMPAWVMLLRTVFGSDLDVVRGANVALLALATLLVVSAVRHWWSPRITLVFAAALILNPSLQYWAGWGLSETLYLAVVVVALRLALDPVRAGGRTSLLAATLAAAAAFLTRVIGLAAIGGVLWAVLLRRPMRTRIIAGLATVVAVGGWYLYSRGAASRTVAWSYMNDLSYIEPVSSPLRFLGQLLGNLKIYVLGAVPRLFGLPDLLRDNPLDNAAWGGLVLVLGIWGLWHLHRRWPAAAMFVLLSCGVLLIFPFALSRLATPLVPWLLVAMTLAALELGGRFWSARRDVPALALLGVFAACGLYGSSVEAVHQLRCRTAANPEMPGCMLPEDIGYRAAARQIERELPPEAVIATSKPSVLYTLTGRKAMPLDLLGRGDPGPLLAPDGPVTHVLLSSLMPSERQHLPFALEPRCTRFRALPQADPGVLLLEVLPPAATADSLACQLLEGFRRDAAEEFDTAPR